MVTMLARIKQWQRNLEERLPQVHVTVKVQPLTWRFSAQARRLWGGELWIADLSVGPFGVGLTLELPRRSTLKAIRARKGEVAS